MYNWFALTDIIKKVFCVFKLFLKVLLLYQYTPFFSKGILVNKENFYKSLKTQKKKCFLITSVKVDQWYILKIHFIKFWRNTIYLRNPHYKQIILKIILRLLRLFAKKIQLLLYRYFYNILWTGKFWGIFVNKLFCVSLLFFTFSFTNIFLLS